MTMTPFPDQHELLTLFECEPVLADKDVPWCYNHLTFKTNRGSDQIVCEIMPSYHALKLAWTRDGQQLVSLDLNSVAGITLELDGQTEAFTATSRDENLAPLRVQLKPHVSVSWGTTIEP